MGSQVLGAELAGEERDELKGKPLGLDHDHARQGEADHDPPVGEGALAETAPALGPVDEADVEEEQEGEEVVGDGDGDGGADEAHVEVPDEQPDHEDVEGRGHDEHVRGGAEEALRLGEALAALEEDEAGDAEDEDAQVRSRELNRLGVGHQVLQDVAGEEPEHGDKGHQREEEARHALELQAHEVLVAGAVCLGA